MAEVRKIMERHELIELARELKVRHDWHEPDEQGLTARVYGDSFDNAMGPGYWYGPEPKRAELYIELFKDGVPIAQINLATLLAWASQSEQSDDQDARERYIRRVTLLDAVDKLLEMAPRA